LISLSTTSTFSGWRNMGKQVFPLVGTTTTLQGRRRLAICPRFSIRLPDDQANVAQAVILRTSEQFGQKKCGSVAQWR
jgi:hypothetical protein